MKLFGSPLSDFIAENENLPDFKKYNWFGAHGEGCTQFFREKN
jgi:hypothetical protein